MRKIGLIIAAIVLLGGGMVHAGSSTCGDAQLACGENEKCCEHRVATFCENEGWSNVRTEGRCIPERSSCDVFWCGNRQCQSSWLISRDVCCVYYPADSSPEFSCAMNELNCPGNTAELMIRPTLATSNDPSG